MKQILVIGADGQLGKTIKNESVDFSLACFTFTSYETVDVTNDTVLEQAIKRKKYDYIINCCAYTSVDDAESNKDLAYKVNSEALKNIGKFSLDIGAKVIHISTDFVFNGKQYMPYTEKDPTSPNSVYGSSKLQGELELQKHNPQSMIIRTSWLYSEFGSNYVKTMIKLGSERNELSIVADQIGTPTYAKDLSDAIFHIIKCDIENTVEFIPEVFHYSNEGVTSWYDFTLAILSEKGITCDIKPIETKDYPSIAKRPAYSVLCKRKIKAKYNIQIPYWMDSLKKCLSAMNN